MRIAALLVFVLSSSAFAQRGTEVAVEPGKAFVAFQHRAWERAEGRIRVFSDTNPDEADATFERIQSIVVAIDNDVFDGMQPRRQASELQVWLLQDRNDYLSTLRMIAGANGANTGGMAVARGAETHVFVYGLNWSTIQHELWHAANSLFVPNIPTWLDEGIATVFEKGTFIGSQFVLGNAPTSWLTHARILKEKEEGWVPLAEFVQSDEDWNQRVADGLDEGRDQYVQAWAIAHFFLFADEGEHRHRVNTMLKRLHQGQDEAAALRAGLGRNLKAVEALERTIHEFIESATETNMVATHQMLETWAKAHAREFPDKGRINPVTLDTKMSLARWMIDARHESDKRNIRAKTRVKAGRRSDPPLITINRLDGAQWTITWAKRGDAFEPVIRWALSQ